MDGKRCLFCRAWASTVARIMADGARNLLTCFGFAGGVDSVGIAES
jgi:hypothetical protein